jgi:transcriptional repressor NrdR
LIAKHILLCDGVDSKRVYATVKCPSCNSGELKVTDSRNGCETNVIRRRRECLKCGLRFTTFETIELGLQVRKRDGRWEDFDQKKLIRGIQSACQHSKVSRDQVNELAATIRSELLQRQNQQIEAMELGEKVMQELHQLDLVAYIRYACVYRRFKELAEMMEAIQSVAAEDQNKLEVCSDSFIK